MNPADGPVLRDIHLPPVPGWWPPAPGWWLLAGIGLLVMALILRWVHQRMAKRRRQLLVMRELDRCVERTRDDPVALAAALSHFLRRLVLRDTPAAAAYEGERWLDYLDRRCGGGEFRQGIGRVLIEAPFRSAMNYDTVALIALVRRWTRNLFESGVAHA